MLAGAAAPAPAGARWRGRRCGCSRGSRSRPVSGSRFRRCRRRVAPERRAQDVRDQMRLGLVVLAGSAAGAGDVEVAQADRAEPVARRRSRRSSGRRRASMRRRRSSGRGGARLGDRHLVGLSVHGAGRGEHRAAAHRRRASPRAGSASRRRWCGSKRSGCSTDSPTRASAAKCRTPSKPSASAPRGGVRVAQVRDARAAPRGRQPRGAPARGCRARRPRGRARSSRLSSTIEPMYPAPPVTSSFTARERRFSTRFASARDV